MSAYSYTNWSCEDDKILIDFVRTHEILYNVKHKNYRKTQTKQRLWCEVGKILNKTDFDCNKRWCYVRDYYIRRKNKPGTGASGEAARKRSNQLSFLDSIGSQRSSITDVIENTQHTIEIPFQNQETEYNITIKQEEEDIVTDNDNNDNNSEENSNNDQVKEDREVKNQKWKHNSHGQERLNLKQMAHRKSSHQNELDETDLFFSSMAKIVKKLPRYEQAQLRMQIGSLVGNAELRNIHVDSASNNSPRPSTSVSDYSESPMRSPQ